MRVRAYNQASTLLALAGLYAGDRTWGSIPGARTHMDAVQGKPGHATPHEGF